MRPARLTAVAGAAGTLLAIATIAPGTASAAPDTKSPAARPAPAKTVSRPSDVREIKPGKKFTLTKQLRQAQREQSARRSSIRAAAATPGVGTVRQWLAIDDAKGTVYRKKYTLRGVGKKVEVWVASDSDDTSSATQFPAGDCRNAVTGSTQVTAAQVNSLVQQFDANMFPKEAAAFSVAPDRNGSAAQISGDYSGNGDKIVTLVDNVRDDNFYNFPAAGTYIAGFFSSQINELLDRNVMTIDAYDWLHRTGANPPDNPTTDPCTSRPARPRLYESTFAHEYQHLLEYYQDPSEVNFVNEGLSDFAESLVGYSNSRASVFSREGQSHLYCFQGFGVQKTKYNPNPRDCGGPQNSLTLWGDEETGDSILADYGNAWSFMLYLRDHYGLPFMSALHRDGKAQGLAGVQDQLNRFGGRRSVRSVLHDFQVMNLVDRAVEGRTGRVFGPSKARVTSSSLSSRLNLLNQAAYVRPGAAPNGADYVGLRAKGSSFLKGSQLKTVTFRGAQTLEPLPLRWTVVNNAPGRAGNSTLWSGNESNLDSAAVTQVRVPAGSPKLTYVERHLAEATFDYAYTIVSTDGGKTYKALANANTVEGPRGPALNGDSPAFATQTFDLTPYAGKTILLGFRYVSDGGVNDGGWYVDDVKVAGTLVNNGTSTAPFKSPTQVRPTPVANWDLRIVGYDEAGHRARVMAFNGKRVVTLTARQVKSLRTYPMVVAVVAHDDPTEEVQQYAPYSLRANSVVQRGGR
jgi:Immune inhibitor A peptidase M6